MEYITSDKSVRCVFCEPDEPVSDRERLILHRGARAFVILNRYPYAAGHLMVAPYAHVGRLQNLEAETAAECMARVADCARILEEGLGCEGLNLGANVGSAAGAGFADHLHFHLVPRWSGDTNFMAVLGELRVIPEHLDRTYEKLAPLFAAIEAG